MDSLCDKIKLLYPDLENSVLEDLYLYYIDEDNDKIRIKFDIELSEALRQTKGTRVLKIYIINLSSPSTTSLSTVDASTIIPFINLLTSLSSIPQAPSNTDFNVALLGSMLPCPSTLDTPNYDSSPVLSTSDFTHINKSTCDSGVDASPVYSSVSTNTLIDAKDAATETLLNSVTQTTQTWQPNSNTHQTTQTQSNSSCATQTAQVAQIPACAAQTQTTQKSDGSAQTLASSAYAPPAALSFYDSLANTQFGSLLQKLQELGFSDKEKCVQALVKYSGHLHEAIDELLLDQLLA